MTRHSRPPALLRRPGIDEEDLDGIGGITELEKFEPERVDGVSQPANGFPVLLMKGLGNSGTAAEEDTVEDDLAKDGAQSDDDSPDTGAPGEDIDGSGDSHEDDDTKASKETSAEDAAPVVAELAEPTAEAVKAAAADYETARRDYLAAEPGLKGADSATELLKARAEWNHWNTLGKDEGLDGTEDGRKQWIVKHLEPKVLVSTDSGNATWASPVGDLVIPEAAAAEPVAELAKELLEAEEAVYKRTFTADERRHAASEGHALPDGSYPIENKGDLDNAAHLARSGHGQVAEAKALIRRRASELGVGNPLDDGNGSATKADGDSDSDDLPAGKKACPTCKGKKTIKDGGMKCPACKGKGFMKPKAAAAKAVREVTEAALKAGMITQQAADEILAQIDGPEVTEKASRPLPATTEPVAAHREPDGTSTVEQLEPEAGLGTDPDKTADKVPASVAALTMKEEAPYVVKRAHDAFCAAYAAKDVLDEYPALTSVGDAAEGMGGWFSGLAAKAAEAGDTTETADLAALVKAAEAVRSYDPAAVEDGRALLHKSFQQMYPTEHISPKDAPKPGSYTRPYLSSSHAAESAGDWTVNIPESTRTPSAEDHQRGYLTAGHASPSPSDHGPNNPQGHDVRQYYTTSQKDMAMAAMRSMHDHISATFAGCCPMAPSTAVMPPGMGAAHAPGTMAPPSQGGLNVGKEAAVFDEDALRAAADAVARKAAKKARKAVLAAAAPAVDPAVIQNMVAEQLDALTGPLNDQIATLRKELDELGKQPDPAMAPVRGQMARRPAGDAAAPVEKRSLIEEARERQTAKAVDEHANYLAYLRMQAENHDPKVRERAEDLLTKEAARVPA